VLEGVSVLVAGAPGEPRSEAGGTAGDAGVGLGAAVAGACAALGASVSTCRPLSDRFDASEQAAADAAVADAVRVAGRIDLLAVDGADLFAHGLARGGDGHAALRACMDGAWSATRAVVTGAFLPAAQGGAQPGAGEAAPRVAGEHAARRGRIVYLAPAPDAGAYATAACAGLENLARTLSIEWARHGVTTVAIAPGAATPAGETAALTAYLASPAGAYFSGCLLDLRGS
jgi:NAD(P)-dependent dehydrogenase (short-subunit alcohol dehydrogenase family)